MMQENDQINSALDDNDSNNNNNITDKTTQKPKRKSFFERIKETTLSRRTSNSDIMTLKFNVELYGK